MGVSKSCLQSSFLRSVKDPRDVNQMDSPRACNPINVNTATEDELLILPGVNRKLARNVVEYREQLGQFLKIEDFALVPGLGADLFTQIRSEICVSDIPATTDVKVGRCININIADVFDLMSVPGIDQKVALNIIFYRRRKGCFKFVEELLKVKGINYVVLAKIRPFVTVEFSNQKNTPPSWNDTLPERKSDVWGLSPRTYASHLKTFESFSSLEKNSEKKDSCASSKSVVLNGINDQPTSSPSLSNYRSTTAVSSQVYRELYATWKKQLEESLEHENADSSHETLKLYKNSSDSLRPMVQFVLDGSTCTSTPCDLLHLVESLPLPLDCRALKFLDPVFRPFEEPVHLESDVLRLCSWNLQQLDLDKVQNSGVLTVICRTFLEQSISIAAIQEIKSKRSLEIVAEEFRCPLEQAVSHWNGDPGCWQCVVSEASGKMYQGYEHLGFIFNSSKNLKLKSSSLLSTSSFTRSPFIAVFECLGVEVIFVNVHLKAVSLHSPTDCKKTEEEVDSLCTLVDAIVDTFGIKPTVIMGDFNSSPGGKVFDALSKRGFKYTIESNTNISSRQLLGSACLDNIWLSRSDEMVYSGNSGVIRQGLTHWLIPNGWIYGGFVSDHCPIFADVRFKSSKI